MSDIIVIIIIIIIIIIIVIIIITIIITVIVIFIMTIRLVSGFRVAERPSLKHASVNIDYARTCSVKY